MIKNIISITLLSLISAEYVYIEQSTKGWHIEPLKLLMQQKSLEFDTDQFAKHGCWCGTNPGTGKPQTSLDHICHQLHQCIKCVDMEHQEECSSGFADFWLVHTDLNNPGKLGCESSPDVCVQKRCGCTEHVLNKIVKHLEKNPGMEMDSSSCPAHHGNGGNGHHKQIMSQEKVILEEVPSVGEIKFSTSSISSNNDQQVPIVESPTYKTESISEKIIKLPQQIVMKTASLFTGNDYESDNTIEEQQNSNILTTNRGIRIMDESNIELNQGATVDNKETNQFINVNEMHKNEDYSSIINTNPSQSKVFKTTYNQEIENVFKQASAPIHNACCGEFPEWFPYEEGNGRQCCSGPKISHTYDIFNLKCCESGATVPINALCPEEEDINNMSGEEIFNISEQEDIERFFEHQELSHNNQLNSNSSPNPQTTNINNKIIPTCNQNTEQLTIDNTNNWYKCQLISDSYKNNQCKSTKQCEYALVPECESNTKLVAYPMDECCNYYYCAPSYTEPSCNPDQCSNKKTCGNYQVKTTNLDSFMECCPETECVCDYNSCPVKPESCPNGQVLITTESEDGCCNEYECIDA
jgi:hypothetical protein